MRSENILGEQLPEAASESDAQDDVSWEEQYAYSLGLQAYVYGFPWVYLSYIKWLWTTQGGYDFQQIIKKKLPWAPVNSFFTSGVLGSPSTPTGGSPNCDTLYAVAWLDVQSEPMIITVPEVTGRFYCLEMACLDSDNFAYIGTSVTGTAAGNYLVGGPGWEGEIPDGVMDVLPRSRTPEIFVLGRTQVLNLDDVDTANGIQQNYKVTPLSSWPDIGPTPPKRDSIDPHSPINPTENTEGTWISMNRAMTKNPPGVPPGIDQTELLTLFATIGVGPNQSWENQSADTKKGLYRAAKDGLPMLRKMAVGRGKMVQNCWAYPPRDIGMAGQSSDFITRAALQALGGIVANNPSVAVYINAAVDSNGDRLIGGSNYTIHFPDTDSFPPFDQTYNGFWSITLYQSSDFNMVPGSTAYTVNNYYPNQSHDGSGGITIYIQEDAPAGYENNGVYWLKTPPVPPPPPPGQKASPPPYFYLILRVYVPGPELSYTQTWEPPPIDKQDAPA